MRHHVRARACSPLVLALLLAAAGCLERVAGDSRSDGARVGPRMLLVGGREAPKDRYPYLTRIHFLLDPEHGAMAGCGGTLISRRVVLTAAHCVVLSRDGGANVFLRVGSHNALLDEARGHPYELRQAVKVKSHPEYVNRGENQPTGPHDIALVLLDAPVPLGYPTVALANESTPYPADAEQLHALGWGALDPRNSRPAFSMQGLGLPAVGRRQCRQHWGYAGAGGDLVGDGHICAGLQSGRNICFGDSGGPLLLRGGGAGSDVQIGLTSFTFPTCALPGMPSVFTFIPYYRQGLGGQWIDEMVAKLDPPPPPPQPSPPPPQPPLPPAPQQAAPAEQTPAAQQGQPAAEAEAAAAAPVQKPVKSEAAAGRPAIVQPSRGANQPPSAVAAAASDSHQLGIKEVEAVGALQPASEALALPLVEPAPAAAEALASASAHGGQVQAEDAVGGASAEGPAVAALPEEPLAATLEPATGSSRR